MRRFDALEGLLGLGAMGERSIASRRIFEGRVINLRVDTVELPDGRTTTREIVEHRGAVAIIPILDDGRIALVRQYRAAIGADLLEVPAGTLEPGEDPADCAARELIEETGLRASRMEKVLFAWMAPGYSAEGIHYYLACDLTPCSGIQDEDENLTVELMDFGKALDMLDAGEFSDAKTVAALCLASRILSR